MPIDRLAAPEPSEATEVEDALRRLFRDFDAGRFMDVAERLRDDVEMADEITGGWLRGRAEVTNYLERLTEQCSDVTSTLDSVESRMLAGDLGMVTFFVRQEYLLDGRPRSSALVGGAVFDCSGDEALLVISQLGSTEPLVALQR
jgi:hypothetical protein